MVSRCHLAACAWVKAHWIPQERETEDHYGIIVNVVAVVVIYELMPERLTEDDPHDRCKNNGDNASD